MENNEIGLGRNETWEERSIRLETQIMKDNQRQGRCPRCGADCIRQLPYGIVSEQFFCPRCGTVKAEEIEFVEIPKMDPGTQLLLERIEELKKLILEGRIKL